MKAFILGILFGLALAVRPALAIKMPELNRYLSNGSVKAWPSLKSQVPAGMAWFQVLVNGDSAVSVTSIPVGGDTTAFQRTFRNGCYNRVRYWGDDHRLNVDWRFWCPDTASFPGGITLGFPTAPGLPFQRTSSGLWIPPDRTWGDSVLQMAPRVRFPGGLEVYMPNVFHSFWRLDRQSRHVLDVLPVWKEVSVLDQKTRACPRILAGDTLHRFFQVRTDSVVEHLAYLSEHPNGHSSSFMMYFDDLPNRDAWEPVSRTHFPKTPNSNIPWLLDRHPRARLGWVLVLDRMFYKRMAPSGTGWIFGRPWGFLDTIAPHAGKYQLLLWAPPKDSAHFYSRVVLKGTSALNLSAWLAAQGAEGTLKVRLHAIEHLQAKDANQKNAGDSILVRKRLLGEWNHSYSARYQGAWNATIARDTADTVQLEFVLPTTDSGLLLDNAYLRQNDTIRNSQGGFERNLGLGILADSVRRHWSDFHGPEHLASRAPKTYLDFLRSLVRKTGNEGWESQAYVGSHGYHHDPSLREPDPSHEYQRTDSVHLRLTQARLFQEMRSLDLYPWASRFIRTPGMAYTGMALNSFVDSGFVFCDAGVVTDYKAGIGWSPTYRVLDRNGKSMWGVAITWWSDGWPINPNALNPSAIDSALSRRRTVVTGGHPEQTFLNDQTWKAYDDLLTRLETRYPGMGYFSPAEWADHANAGRALRIALIGGKADAPGLLLEGTIRAGQSVVLEGGFGPGDTLLARLDGLDVPVRMDYPSAYVVLPAAGPGRHQVDFRFKEPDGVMPDKRAVSGSAGDYRDAKGRRVAGARGRGALIRCPEGSISGCRGRIQLGPGAGR